MATTDAKVREAIAALRYAHNWLEEHHRLGAPRSPGGPCTGYIGLDHKLGENDEGCTLCHAVARLEGRTEPVEE